MAIKILKGILSTNHSLIGFIISGKEKELGGVGTEVVQRSISIDEMMRSGFKNKQMSIVNNRIITNNKFKINQLPMVVYDGNNYYNYDNKVELISRYVQNNENIGFRVRFADGTEDNLKYQTVITICNWFNPVNFCIRTSSTNKSYICAKQGFGSIDNLPAEVIGTPSTAKRTKSAAKEKENGTKGSWENGMDIIDIYDFINACNGNVIKLPDESYIAASEKISGDGAFSSLGIGEVASANLEFNNSKLNVNAGFKKVGNVKINMNGSDISVPTFTYRKKSIFLNGENYTKKFGIAVDKDKEAELVNTLSKTLALHKIEDLATIMPIRQILGNSELVFYKVDTSKIDLISPDKRKASILSNSDIIQYCKKLYALKLLSKATGLKGGIMKEIKEVFGPGFVAEATNKKVFSTYAMYTKEGLELLEKSGVDIYSGAYTAPQSEVKANSNYSGDDSVSIEYVVDGFDAGKLTGAKIVELVRSGSQSIPKQVSDVIEKLLSIEDFQQRYAECMKVNKNVEKEIAEINRIMWMHNASMFIEGGKSRVHTHDSSNWVPETNTRVKKALVFRCREQGCESLLVKLTNITI